MHPLAWILFFVLVGLLLALDLGVLHRDNREMSLREAAGWSIFWVSLGLGFTGVVYGIYHFHWFGADITVVRGQHFADGAQAALQYLTAYVLEKSLSVDNLFVISLVFVSLGVPRRFQHRVLFWGILGAIVMRAVMLVGGLWLVKRFDWIFYIFGALLLISGLRMFRIKEDEIEPETGWLVRMARRVVPISHDLETSHFTVKIDGVRHITHLALALVAVESADVIFAVDSIPAVLAVTSEPFIAVTSNVFALLGLRSLYFVLVGMVNKFEALKPALALILCLIGIKLLLHSWISIPTWGSLVAIGVVLAGGIVASILGDRKQASSSE